MTKELHTLLANTEIDRPYVLIGHSFAELSTNSKQVTAEQSGHFIQLQQPHPVIDAIREVVQATPE